MDRVTVMPNFAVARNLDELKRILTQSWSEMANLVNNTFTLYVQGTQPTIPNNTTSLWQDISTTPNQYYLVSNFGGTHKTVQVFTTGLQKARMYNTGAQVLASGETKVQWTTDDFDTHNITNLTDDRVLPTLVGYYIVKGAVGISDLPTGNTIYTVIYKNGNAGARGTRVVNATAGDANFASIVTDLVYCNGSTDYIELYVNVGGDCSTDAAVSYLSVVGPF